MRIQSGLNRRLLAAAALAALQAVAAHAQYAAYPPAGQTYPSQSYPTQSYPPASYPTHAYPPPSYPPAQATAAQPAYRVATQPAYRVATQPAYRVATQPAAPPATRPAMAPPAMQPAAPVQAQAPAAQAQQPIAPGAPYQLYTPGAPAYQAPVTYVASAPAGAAPASAAPAAPGVPAVSYPQPGYAGVYNGYGAAPRVAMAQQSPSAPAENLPLTPPAESAPPEASFVNPEPVADGAYAAQPAPVAEAQGAYGAYGTDAAGASETCATCNQPGNMACSLGSHISCGYWFGGVYGLLMERDNANNYPVTFAAPTLPADGFPGTTDGAVLNANDSDVGYQGGVEFRLGRTFGAALMGPGGDVYGPRWGLEGVYWQIFENDSYSYYNDNQATRTYSMIPMTGLEHDGTGGAFRPLNEYWDYAPPASTNDIEVLQSRVRSEFQVQNVEVNLLRLSLAGGAGAGGAMYNVDYGSGYGLSRFSCTGVCGVRYMQFDESFMYGVDYLNTSTTETGYLNYWSNAENDLVGFQLGCNGMYRIGNRWGVHMNTLVGLYGNDVNVHQYMVSPTGLVRYTATGEAFDAQASKTDVAMIGEFRLGASYQMSSRFRLYGGWRAIGVTGIALASNQTPNQFLSAAQMASFVNSNGSMILHGLQTGVEWNY